MNKLMWAQVIPPQRRSLAYSLDLAISGIINAATMPLAGMVIEHYGGHAATRVSDDDASDAPAPAAAPADNLSNARAIEDGLLLLIMLSFGVKLFVRPHVNFTGVLLLHAVVHPSVSQPLKSPHPGRPQIMGRWSLALPSLL